MMHTSVRRPSNRKFIQVPFVTFLIISRPLNCVATCGHLLFGKKVYNRVVMEPMLFQYPLIIENRLFGRLSVEVTFEYLPVHASTACAAHITLFQRGRAQSTIWTGTVHQHLIFSVSCLWLASGHTRTLIHWIFLKILMDFFRCEKRS